MRNGAWRDGVKAEDAVGIFIIYRTKRLGSILLMALPGKALQKCIHLRITAVEGGPIMGFSDRLFVPNRKAHRVSGSAAIAARSLALGFGGLSNRSMMRM